MLGPLTRRCAGCRQRGLSLVELMIGLALGLFIVAVATTLLLSRLQEHRALLLESRLMQDLRSAASLVARDLRRAGHWGDAAAGLWRPGTAPVANPYTAVAPDAGTTDTVHFRYSRDAVENHLVDSHEEFGFRLHNGAIEMAIGSGSWQALTDKSTLQVLSFSITPGVQRLSLAGLCASPCPPGAADCPPTQQLRSATIAITGRSTTDQQVVRSAHSQVRLRNDVVTGRCPA